MSEVGSERLVGKILLDAEGEVQSILERSRQTSRSIVEQRATEAKKKAEEEVKASVRRAEEDARRIVESAVTNAKIRMNWAILEEKQRLITEALKKVEAKLKDFAQTSHYSNFLRSLILEGIMATGGGKLEIVLTEDDADKPLRLEELAEDAEKKVGKKTMLSKSTQCLDGIGGVVVRSPDGKISVDNRLEAVLDRKRKDLEPKIASILFRE